MTSYTWVVEEVDAEGDIIDTTSWTTAREAIAHMSEPEPDCHFELSLLRDPMERNGDREWAYVEDGSLPSHFDGGTRVPQKYVAELAAAR